MLRARAVGSRSTLCALRLAPGGRQRQRQPLAGAHAHRRGMAVKRTAMPTDGVFRSRLAPAAEQEQEEEKTKTKMSGATRGARESEGGCIGKPTSTAGDAKPAAAAARGASRPGRIIKAGPAALGPNAVIHSISQVRHPHTPPRQGQGGGTPHEAERLDKHGFNWISDELGSGLEVLHAKHGFPEVPVGPAYRI